MEYLLFFVYLMFFTWLVTKAGFLKSSGLSSAQLIIIFLVKVIAGIFYGWVGIYYSGTAQMVDTWNYHHQSLLEYDLLWKDPGEYFTNLFTSNYPDGYGHFFASKDSYWNDLKSNVFIKFLSLINIFSFGHYYVNVVFYSFLALFGPVALYRVWKEIFPEERWKWVLVISVFLIPSFLYWCSGIHKEGMIFLALGGLSFHMYFGLKRRHFPIGRCLIILGCLATIFLLRNFLLIVIGPALLAWTLASYFPVRRRAIYFGLYGLFMVLFFTLRYIDSRLDFPQLVVDKQNAFLQLKGRSTIPIRELDPGVTSFILKTPQAFTLSAVRPYPSDIRHLLSLVAAIETNVILLLVVLYFFFHRKTVHRKDAFIYFSIFFSITLLLTIGFSVNNLGAIVRYRSIIIPFLLTPVIMQIDWNRLFDLFLSRTKRAEQ